MDTNSYLISPNSHYRQVLRLILNESEISDLYQLLSQCKEAHLSLPEVAKDLRTELWYMLVEVKEFNLYLQGGGEP